MMLILIFLMSLAPSSFALSDSQAKNLFEKTWPRSNSHCTHGKNRLEIQIRGGQKFTERQERGFGEYVFYRFDSQVHLFNFSKSQSSLYHFYKGGADSSCSKSPGYPIDGEKFAILLGEENLPHGEKLVIQLFDFKEMKPLETIETNLLVEKVYARPGGFVFKTMQERYDVDMGTVPLKKDNYTYQDRVFPIWRKYTSKGIEVDPETTFEKLPWKRFFKDKADFLKCSGWDPETRTFKNTQAYIAVKQPMKHKCVLFTPKKQKFTGSEDWHCD